MGHCSPLFDRDFGPAVVAAPPGIRDARAATALVSRWPRNSIFVGPPLMHSIDGLMRKKPRFFVVLDQPKARLSDWLAV